MDEFGKKEEKELLLNFNTRDFINRNLKLKCETRKIYKKIAILGSETHKQ